MKQHRNLRAFIGAMLVVIGLILIPATAASATPVIYDAAPGGTTNFTPTGTWTTDTSRSWPDGGSMIYTNTNGLATFTFSTAYSGGTVGFRAPKGWNLCDVTLNLDGTGGNVSETQGSTGSDYTPTATIYTYSGVAAGSHTFTASRGGGCGASGSSNGYIFVDSISVEDGTAPVTTTTTTPPSGPTNLGCKLWVPSGSGPTVVAKCNYTSATPPQFLRWTFRQAGGSSSGTFDFGADVGTVVVDTTSHRVTFTRPLPSSFPVWPIEYGNPPTHQDSTVFDPSGGAVSIPTLQISTSSTGFPDGAGTSTAPTPLLSCSRTLSDATAKVGYFKSTKSPAVTGATDVLSWNFGDSTNSTAQNPTKTYSGTMPDGGWTATVTLTRTGNGTTYDPTPITVTCSLRVDFLNPDNSTPGSTDGNGPDDSYCPSGWGWLNPAAIVNVLKCLFIPSSTSVSSLGTIWGDIKTKAPFSYVYQALTLVPRMMDSFRDGISWTTGDSTCGPTQKINFGDITLDGNPHCGSSPLYDARTFIDSMNMFIEAVLIVGTAMMVYRTISDTIGK